jgi:hypothetical protein
VSPSDIKNRAETSTRVQKLIKAKQYVPRPDLEKKIMSILNRKEANDKYLVLYGLKGGGKSVLIDKCIMQRKGVVKVLVSSVFHKSAILQVMTGKILGKGAPVATEEELAAALEGAKVGGRLATVVFEIERGDSTDQMACVANVRSLSKLFAEVCNCIIVLSEAKAIVAFGRDPAREIFVLVPELTFDQAMMYINARGSVVEAEEMKHVFDNVGANVAMLRSFVDYDGSVEAFIQEWLDTAEQSLMEFPFKPILTALKIFPEGVRPAYFKNIVYKNIDMSVPSAVGMAMDSNAVLYDIVEKRYKLMSQAHKVALRHYEPEPPSESSVLT